MKHYSRANYCGWRVALALIAVAASGTSAWAVPRSWIAGNGLWSTAANWSPSGVPATGDDVSIAPADGVSRSVTYNYAGPPVALNFLIIDLTGMPGGTTTLLMPGNALSSTDQHVGYTGSGTFLQTGGTVTLSNALFVGTNFGSTGNASVSGATTILDSAWMSVGYQGEGSLSILDGAAVAVQNKTSIGDALNGVGAVVVSGADSTLDIVGWMDVGSFGHGTLAIEDGGLVSGGPVYIGANPSGFGRLTVTGGSSTFNPNGIAVGNLGNGEMVVENGGIADSLTNISIGYQDGSIGDARASGAGSTLHAAWGISVGDYSYGTLTLENGGVAEADNGFWIGSNTAGIGEALVTGAGSRLEGEWDVIAGNHGQGTLTVRDGGLVTTPGWIISGNENGGRGSFNVEAGGTASADGNIAIGHLTGSDGEMLVTGSGAELTGPWMDVGKFGRGVLRIENGGQATIENAPYIGGDEAGVGEIRIAGADSALNIGGWINLGSSGRGTLVVESGGAVANSGGTFIGAEDSGVGELRVHGSDSTFVAGWVTVGNHGQGSVEVELGGSVTALNGFDVGYEEFSEGDVVVSGPDSIVTGTWYVNVGVHGSGSLTVGSGGLVTTPGDVDIAVGPDGRGTVHINSGGTLAAGGNSHIGGWWQEAGGQGVVNVNPGGTFNVAGTLSIWNAEGNALNLRGGTINTAGLNFDGNPGLFNWTGGTLHLTTSVTFDSFAAGNTTSAALGPARTISASRILKITGNEQLGGAGSFGLTVTNGGRHEVSGSLVIGSIGTLNLHTGGTITANSIHHTSGGAFNFTGGTLHVETFTGNLLNAGGTLAPGTSPGTTTVHGNYTQNAGTLHIELGSTAFDKLGVNGTLSLGGMLQVELLPGFSPGPGASFDILDWTTRLNTFSSLQLPGLSPGLAWNTSLLYTDGVLSVGNAATADINGDGDIDPLDYVLWRISNGPPAQYDEWRASYEPGAIGSGSAMFEAHAYVPEPTTAAILFLALCAVTFFRHPSSRQ